MKKRSRKLVEIIIRKIPEADKYHERMQNARNNWFDSDWAWKDNELEGDGLQINKSQSGLPAPDAPVEEESQKN